MIVFPPRYSTVPWLADSDLRAYGPPETTIEMGGGRQIIHGLLIHAPFGAQSDLILTIAADMDTEEITLRVLSLFEIDTDVPAEPSQSNPRRVEDDAA